VSAAPPGRLAAVVDDLLVGGRLLARLPAYLRHPLDVETSRGLLRVRLGRREADFLALVRATVFERPGSPYRVLLERAGCAYGDLAGLVARNGLEDALRELYAAGVYLTVDEFKGRRPVVRGNTTIAVDPGHLRNPLSTASVWGATSASRGAGTRVPIDLASSRDRAVNTCLVLDARGGGAWEKAVWGAPGIGPFLRHCGFGRPVTRWFSHVDPAAHGLHPRYRWSGRWLGWVSGLAGRPLPSIEHAPLDRPEPVARWMAGVLRQGRVPHLWAFPTSALRVCEAARVEGLDLAGARFTVTGEPVTAPRLDSIRAAGADAVPDYGSADSGGFVAYGCLRPQAADDVHVFQDLNALVQPGGAPGPLPPDAILLSSLRATAPFVLLNVSMGDRATLIARQCGCALEALGWAPHLHTIRSFEKLTAAGMTFLDVDVVRVLEEVLPRHFGGGPADYQLTEEEGPDGQPRLLLLVHPSVGPLESERVVEAFLGEIGRGSGTERIMAGVWARGGFVRVERRAPIATAAGKVLHLQAGRPGRLASSTGDSAGGPVAAPMSAC
jgi:hypothetical protein